MRNSGQIMLCLVMGGLFATANAAPPSAMDDSSYQLAQNSQPSTPQGLPPPPPPSGTLLLPGDQRNNIRDSDGKKCMTVCAEWGEECSYINRGTAGTTRSCRRSCLQFKEECF